MSKKTLIHIALTAFALFLLLALVLQKNTASDLVLEDGKYPEPVGGYSFLEAIEYSFIASGITFQYGATKELVENGIQQILTINVESTRQVATTEDDNVSNLKVSSDGTVEKVNQLEQDMESDASNLDLKDTYKTETFKTKDLKEYESQKDQFDEKDETFRITLPVDVKKDNYKTTSNAWKLNYRFYDGALTGLDRSYWYSQWFLDEDNGIYDRAWTSLKWLAQNYLNCEIIADEDEVFEILIYGEQFNYEVIFEKLKIDMFDIGTDVNTIAMTSIPLSEEDSAYLLKSVGIITEAE